MDNLTHTLTAVAISNLGLNRKTRLATLTVILGANAPDIYILARLKDSTAYLKYHRGLTHSFLGIAVLALVVWGVMLWIAERRRGKSTAPLDSRWLLAAAFLGTTSHLLLDFTNSYGVRLFLPFCSRWYAWNIMFIFDPLLLTLLVLSLSVPWVLGMVSEEIGAQKPHLARGAVFALCALVALWGLRDFARRRSTTSLDSRTYSEENLQRVGAFPSPADPFSWTGVVETATAFHVLRVNALNPDSSPQPIQTLDKPEPSPPLEAAMKSRTGRVFMDFARFPWATVEQTEDGYLVSLQDLRFYRGSAHSRNFVAEIDLDKRLQPVSESFSFTGPPRRGHE